MLEFSFAPIDQENGLSDFSVGHISVSGEFGMHSSADGYQPVLLLLAVDELLAGMLTFLQSNTDKQYIFASLYGGYRFKVVRRKDKPWCVYALDRRERLLAYTTPQELRHALWTAVHNLLTEYPYHEEDSAVLSETDTIREERHKCLQAWRTAFPELDAVSTTA